MKSKTTNAVARINKYDISIILIIVSAAIFILIVWAWFGHKNKLIENELQNSTTFINN